MKNLKTNYANAFGKLNASNEDKKALTAERNSAVRLINQKIRNVQKHEMAEDSNAETIAKATRKMLALENYRDALKVAYNDTIKNVMGVAMAQTQNLFSDEQIQNVYDQYKAWASGQAEKTGFRVMTQKTARMIGVDSDDARQIAVNVIDAIGKAVDKNATSGAYGKAMTIRVFRIQFVLFLSDELSRAGYLSDKKSQKQYNFQKKLNKMEREALSAKIDEQASALAEQIAQAKQA